MQKSQSPEAAPSIIPISHDVLSTDFHILERYDSDNLEHLKSLWMHENLHNNPSHKLLALEARPYVEDAPSIRRAYRAGVLAGTHIVRHQLSNMYENPEVLNLEEGEPMPIEWPPMKLARFALSTMFVTTEDVSRALRDKVERSWRAQHNTFQPAKKVAKFINNDWLAIGVGDAIALSTTVHAIHHRAAPPRFRVKPLKPEPLLGLSS